jgi:hypothetical protein
MKLTKLKEAYLEYNCRYFRNSLPRDTKVLWGIENESCLGYARRECAYPGIFKTEEAAIRARDKINQGLIPEPMAKYTIWIHPKTQFDVPKSRPTKVALMTLLHEMVHLKLWKKYPKEQHGHRFNKEMKRLARVGAFRNLW